MSSISVSLVFVWLLGQPLAAARQMGETSAAEAYYQFLRGRQLESGGDLDGAVAAYQRAAGLDPGSAEIQAELAGLYALQDRVEDAGRAARAALALDDDNREAHRILGTISAARAERELPGAGRQRHAVDAVAHLERARSDRIVDPNLELTLGRAYVRAGQFEKSVAVLKRFVEEQPGMAEALVLLAEGYDAMGRTAEVAAAYETAVEQNPGSAELKVRLGFAYQRLGDYDRAIAAFQQAHQAAAGSSALDTYLLQAYVAGNRIDQAIAFAADARARYPEDPRLPQLEAEALRRAGRFTDAVALLEGVLVRHADEPSVYVALSELHTSARAFDAALDVLKQARTKHPDDVSVAFQLGAVFERAGRYLEAEVAFRDVLAKDPLHAPALNYLGYMFADRGERLDEAVDLIARAVTIEPGNGSYLDSLGWAYFKLGKLDLAERHLRDAAAQLLSNSVVQDHYGDVLSRQGRFD
ncbi:MAG: tetratricopeptide repeat protein, partial [Acidobacteria bacterium]|nr:tetratricopeptide repeat protein [Acidobacteriota bacterium]